MGGAGGGGGGGGGSHPKCDVTYFFAHKFCISVELNLCSVELNPCVLGVSMCSVAIPCAILLNLKHKIQNYVWQKGLRKC